MARFDATLAICKSPGDMTLAGVDSRRTESDLYPMDRLTAGDAALIRSVDCPREVATALSDMR